MLKLTTEQCLEKGDLLLTSPNLKKFPNQDILVRAARVHQLIAGVLENHEVLDERRQWDLNHALDNLDHVLLYAQRVNGEDISRNDWNNTLVQQYVELAEECLDHERPLIPADEFNALFCAEEEDEEHVGYS